MSEANTLPGSARPLLTKLFLVLAGYVIAVTVAVFVTVVIMLSPTALPDNGAQGSIFATLAQLMPAALVVGFFWTFLCAWPGFLVAIVLGETSRWQGWLPYAKAGFVNVIPSLAIYGGMAGSPFQMPMMVLASFFGGFAGGVAYWLCAGRFVALRRKVA